MMWRPSVRRSVVRRVVVSLAAISLMGAACSGSDSPSADPEATGSTVGEAAPSTEAPAADPGEAGMGGSVPGEGDRQGGSDAEPPPEATDPGDPGAAARGDGAPEEPDVEDLPPLETEVTLAEDCVRPGGTQTITVDTGESGSGVVYDTVYSDGKTGLAEDHYGGNNGGHTDDSGTWQDRWAVSPEAPAGEARVDVLTTSADGRTGAARDTFRVADALGRCS